MNFEQPPHSRVTARLWLAAIATAALALITYSQTRDYPSLCAVPYNLPSAVLGLELASSAGQVRTLLTPGGLPETAIRAMFRSSTLWDLAFIPAYGLLLVFVFQDLGDPWRRRLGTGLVLLTMAADFAEDWAIWREMGTPLEGLTDGMALLTRTFSLIKWGAFSLALLVAGLRLFRLTVAPYSRGGSVLLAMVVSAGGLAGLTGLAPGDGQGGVFAHQHLSLASTAFALLAVLLLLAPLLEWVGHRLGGIEPAEVAAPSNPPS